MQIRLTPENEERWLKEGAKLDRSPSEVINAILAVTTVKELTENQIELRFTRSDGTQAIKRIRRKLSVKWVGLSD